MDCHFRGLTVIGRSATNAFSFERREYKFMSFDLGEGIPRKQLWLSVLIVVVWFGLLTLTFGLPGRNSIIVYLTAPVVFAVFAFRPSKTNARRTNLTTWVLAVRYVLIGHVGIVSGRPMMTRAGRIPLSQRTGVFDRALASIGRGESDPWHIPTVTDIEDIEGGRGVVFTHVARIYRQGE